MILSAAAGILWSAVCAGIDAQAPPTAWVPSDIERHCEASHFMLHRVYMLKISNLSSSDVGRKLAGLLYSTTPVVQGECCRTSVALQSVSLLSKPVCVQNVLQMIHRSSELPACHRASNVVSKPHFSRLRYAYKLKHFQPMFVRCTSEACEALLLHSTGRGRWNSCSTAVV